MLNENEIKWHVASLPITWYNTSFKNKHSCRNDTDKYERFSYSNLVTLQINNWLHIF